MGRGSRTRACGRPGGTEFRGQNRVATADDDARRYVTRSRSFALDANETLTSVSGPISFADKPTLVGDLVTLRAAKRADATELLAVDPETIRLTGTHRRFTLAELEQWYATRADHDDRVDWAIVENATGRWAGEAVLNDLDADNASCSFRILLQGPEFFGRGLGSEATRLAIGHAFAVGVHRVELEVYDFNPRARRVYEKAGFRHEGTRRDALRWDGAWVDAHLMAILATDRTG